MKTKTSRILALLFVCAVLLSIVACGDDPLPEEGYTDPDYSQTEELPLQTQSEEPPPPNENVISTCTLVSDLREAFADTQTVEYQESLWNVARNQEFYVELEFDILADTAFETISDIFAVFADADLTQPLWADWDIITHSMDPTVPQGHNRLIIRPTGSVPIGRVFGSFFDLIAYDVVTLEESGEFFLHEGEWGETWGFLRHFYVALLVDPVTALPLERPYVNIFTLENQLDAPQSEFFVTRDGRGAFRWEAVEGADYYLIVKVDPQFTTQSVMWPVDKTTELTWIHPEWVSMNQHFLAIEDEEEMPEDGSEGRHRPIRNFTVIAVNSQTHSPMGTIHNGADLAARLAHFPALALIEEEAAETGGSLRYAPSIGLLPMQRPLIMANGGIVQRRIVYNFDNIETFETRYVLYDESPEGEMQDVHFETVLNLRISYVIEETTFQGAITVENINPDTYREELEAFRRRMEDAVSRGGGAATIILSEGRPTEEGPDIPEEIATRTGDNVFANSALSAFLAHNMLAANTFIDLSEFPESANWELLSDALFEAIYQNPLILQVSGASTIPGTHFLFINYRKPVDTIREQQDAIRHIVPEIIGEIITDGMTDLEKSMAINQFLVKTAEYDWAALESAEQFDFRSVDPRYYNSFTAYGILINRVGVCAGYAAAFKLLADEAGLESIVVTGYLEGFLPHAWNRVNIDGQWHTIDVTNNSNEFLFNVFLHLPDDVAGSILVEDSNFLLNDFLGYHRSDDVSSEYFHVTDRFFDRDTIAPVLADSIRETGRATLRTDFDLDDIAFFEIALEVMVLLDTVDIYGFHWLGVIFMTDGR